MKISIDTTAKSYKNAKFLVPNIGAKTNQAPLTAQQYPAQKPVKAAAFASSNVDAKLFYDEATIHEATMLFAPNKGAKTNQASCTAKKLAALLQKFGSKVSGAYGAMLSALSGLKGIVKAKFDSSLASAKALFVSKQDNGVVFDVSDDESDFTQLCSDEKLSK